MTVHLEPRDVPLEAVLERIARFDELQYNPERYPDNGRDGNAKKIFTVLGPGLEVNNAGDSLPAIPIEEGFNITYVQVKPGNGPSLHVHDGNETFIPVNGRWKIIFGSKEEHSIELGPLDCIAVPAYLPRRFVNITVGTPDEENILIAVLAGSRPKAMFVDPTLN
ncbi:hypothetical protein P3H15_50505 [Rhodococcus sp. T2V]|uniref:hypothetical protein n=1 Tax=Rhodococcus sp. T2V TaxID=3034164 RepID=UPI0023E18F71|nr:hypothetical protein [Rhodococcus sp. T2V]MDF3313154.1 hypothetical protein [Rhodococcus sp. T2V]